MVLDINVLVLAVVYAYKKAILLIGAESIFQLILASSFRYSVFKALKILLLSRTRYSGVEWVAIDEDSTLEKKRKESDLWSERVRVEINLA